MATNCNQFPIGHPETRHIRWESAGDLVRRCVQAFISRRVRREAGCVSDAWLAPDDEHKPLSLFS
jgi:hypothetical protein